MGIDWAAVANLAKIFHDDDKLMERALEQNDTAARQRAALVAHLRCTGCLGEGGWDKEFSAGESTWVTCRECNGTGVIRGTF